MNYTWTQSTHSNSSPEDSWPRARHSIHFLPTATVIHLLLCHIKMDMSKSAFVVNKVYPECTKLLFGEVKHTYHSEWAERKNSFVIWSMTLWFYVKILEL